MAYDFGTNTLGIRNPFRLAGLCRIICGLSIAVLGVVPLLAVPEVLEQDLVKAWVNVGLGLTLLVWGFTLIGAGSFQLFKYFVGRSVPTSLAYNQNTSEAENAEIEKAVLAYDDQKLESMLMGRKNSTFAEPIGWIARLIHSLLPRLIFTPFPIRNFVQELGSLVISAVVAMLLFTVAYFVSVSGLAGSAGSLITPVLSFLLLLYLIIYWRGMASSLSEERNQSLHKKNASSLAKLLVIAVMVPVLMGYGYSLLAADTQSTINFWFEQVVVFEAWSNLALFFVISLAVIAVSAMMIRERFRLAQPKTEVAEFRDNMQESVHPNEIFINIENIVLANRRYKEIPNRIYQGFKPVLQEQSQGKGNFKGQLLIETQPEYVEIQYSPAFKSFRLLATVVAQVLLFVSALLFYFLVENVYEAYLFASNTLVGIGDMADDQAAVLLGEFGALISGCLALVFSWQTVLAGGRILDRGTHLFWSEMHFSSLLMWMKTEGTYTESKISTGMSIHDSTRSENVVVRSSITPWIITSRIISATFATSGMHNLEMPRFVLNMEKNNEEMDSIVNEIRTFLRGREAIASITNEKDLDNATTIYQVNQGSRSGMLEQGHDYKRLEEQGGAARHIEQQQDEQDER